MTTLRKIDRRGWLAWWLQQRRRERVVVPPPPAPILLLLDLMAYWTLDESSGDFWDSSGNGKTAYDVGFDPMTHGAAGKINSGASCEAFGQYLTAPVSNLSGDFSIALWLVSSTTDYFTCLSQTDLGWKGWILTANPDVPSFGLIFYVYTGDPGGGGGGGFGVIAPEVIDDAWHHIVCVRSGSSILIYKDGQLADSSSSGFAMSPAPSDLMFFDNSTSLGQTFVGTMDEVGVWQRALSVAEVGQLYNNGNGLAFGSF